jgi:hypothetical protein
MIQFDKPENLNGTELLAELNANKIKITEPPVLDGNNNFWLEINPKDEDKAKEIVAAHNGTIIPPDYSAARLALLDRLGITADEAKLLLS